MNLNRRQQLLAVLAIVAVGIFVADKLVFSPLLHAWDERAARIAKHPAKRLGLPQELGNTCAFLCSVHAGYINGQNILLDGGSFPGVF